MTSAPSAAKPLADLRVLDFSTLVPGPLASLLLAEAGAEVLKVERPGGGDDLRAYGPAWGGIGASFALLNRGKASLVADLKRDDDRAHVRALARTADVLIEQFRPGVMARLGLGYDELRRDNPALIYCSITGYGQQGPRAQVAGHDLNYLAEAGLLGLSRGADGAPVLPPVLAAEIGGGAYPAVIDILLALQQRRASGCGCHLDVAMTDNLFAFAYAGLASGQAGAGWPRPGGELTTGGCARYGIYRTADGEYLAAAPIEERFWQVFCSVIGLEGDERDDQRDPAGTAARVAERIGRRSAAAWRERFAGRDACVSVVASLQDARSDPAFAARGLFERVVSAHGQRMAALPLPLAAALRGSEHERAAPQLDAPPSRRRWASAARSEPQAPYGLDGMRILVAGAAGDIGRAAARLCSSLGAELVLADRVAVPELLDELRAGGRGHRFVEGELGLRRGLERLCAAVAGVDAAVLDSEVFAAASPDDAAGGEEPERELPAALRATARFARLLLPGMKARGGGCIVLLGPGGGRRSGGDAPPPEAAPNVALHRLVRALARDAAPEVRVNAVASRGAAAADMAWPIAFLCSRQACVVDASVLDAGGGMAPPDA